MQSVLDDVAALAGFGERDAKVLASLAKELGPAVPGIADAFYDAIARVPDAAAVITGGDEQIRRLKGALTAWIEQLFGGVYDAAYVSRRSRIGLVHVRIGLEQRHMFGAMSVIRRGLHDALSAASVARDLVAPGHAAIDRVCDLELAIMLEAYRAAESERLRTKERLATLGELAAGIGHDLRNPLAVIETSAHLLGRRIGEDNPKARRHVDRIAEQVSIASGIITDLLELARDQPPKRVLTDVASLVRAALSATPERPGATVELEIDESLPRASLDPGQIRQLVTNLVLNAAQAVTTDDRTGRVTVGVRAADRDLLIIVTDDGHGIPAEVLPRIFEPLFTTRTRGIGLGLSICGRIVDKHGGSIRAFNRDGGGAAFEVVLPNALES